MPSLRVNGYDMAYAEAGAGELLLLLHGSLSDHRYWAPQMAVFAARWRVVAPSLRHHWPEQWAGPTEAEPGGFTIRQHVEDVAAFIAALGAGPVRLVGHSRGGHIAFRVAERHPNLVRALVLAEPGGELDESLGGTPPAPGGVGGLAALFAEAAALVRAGEAERAMRGFMDGVVRPGAWEGWPEEIRRMHLDNATTLLGQINEGRAPFSRAAAEAIRLPTLLVGGADSQPNFAATLDALERAIPGARRVTIPQAAHAMSRDNPAAFNAAVLEFLAAN